MGRIGKRGQRFVGFTPEQSRMLSSGAGAGAASSVPVLLLLLLLLVHA